MKSLHNFILTRRLGWYNADLLHRNPDFCPITCQNFQRFSTPVTTFPELNQPMRRPELSKSFGWHKRLTVCITIPIPCGYNQAICAKLHLIGLTISWNFHKILYPEQTLIEIRNIDSIWLFPFTVQKPVWQTHLWTFNKTGAFVVYRIMSQSYS